jgi:hypothetical protein
MFEEEAEAMRENMRQELLQYNRSVPGLLKPSELDEGQDL